MNGHLDVEVTDERGVTSRALSEWASSASTSKKIPPACCTARAPTALVQPDGCEPRGPALDGDRLRARHQPRPKKHSYICMKLRHLLRWIGVSTGNMEEGAFRWTPMCRCALSGQKEFGTKVEVKNMNSFKSVRACPSIRSRAADRRAGAWRAHCAGDTGLGRPASVHRFPAHQRAGPRLPLLPRTRPAASDLHDRARRGDTRLPCPSLPDARHARFVAQYGLSAYDAANS